MPERDFYNVNEFTAFPLVEADSRAFSGGGELPRRGLVDAGFILGLDSQFDAAAHTVTLFSVTRGISTVVFDFRSSAPGLSGYRWLFTFTVPSLFGCTVYAIAEHLITTTPNVHLGTGYLTVGNLAEILALPIGTKLMAAPPRIEPALLQSLVNTFVRSINTANAPRRCPPKPCSSSSSSSSSLSADTAFAQVLGLVGDVKFSEGYNMRISLNEADNSIEFAAERGSGLGEPCEDVVVDENGFQRGHECENCDAFIRSINGRVVPTGRLRLVGGPGVVVAPDPTNHKLCVTIEEDFACSSS
jgi:hypothetical protein